ncbi:MAG: type II toxin-antitoxin system antitoxin SocA domain-containing protein [Fibrobacteria bacterium]
MGYSAKAVANYFLGKAEAEGEKLSPMKIQKLVYFAHGWHLAIYGRPLIDEEIQAWQYGPVIRSLYHEFKEYGNSSILGKASEWEIKFPMIKNITPGIDDAETMSLLDRVWEVYKKYSAVQLSNLTHITGSPWEKTWGATGAPKNTPIPNELIAGYFKSIGNKAEA